MKYSQTIGLQSSLVTEAWTGAYLYFGAPWKQEDNFYHYLFPPGKIRAKTPTDAHGFFNARKARSQTQEEVDDLDLAEGPLPVDDGMD